MRMLYSCNIVNTPVHYCSLTLHPVRGPNKQVPHLLNVVHCSHVHASHRLATSTAQSTCVALIYFVQPASPRNLSLEALGQAAGSTSGVVCKGSIAKGDNGFPVVYRDLCRCALFAYVCAPAQSLVSAGGEVVCNQCRCRSMWMMTRLCSS